MHAGKLHYLRFYAIFYVAITPFLNIKMEKGYLYPKKGEHAQATERFVQEKRSHKISLCIMPNSFLISVNYRVFFQLLKKPRQLNPT